MPQASLKEMLASSELVFSGTVKAVRASELPELPVDDRTVVVEVGETVQGPLGVAPTPGSRVTVQLSPALPLLEPGESATFFVTGWVYGDTLAVQEVGRTVVAEQAPRSLGPAALEAARAELADEELVQHAREADAIVRGHVVGLSKAPVQGPPSEHAKDVWIATIAVEQVERGELPPPTETVSVLYANSRDVRWRRHPKPKAGQAGLWLLHRAPADDAALAPFELAHPIDVQPSMRLDTLRAHGI